MSGKIVFSIIALTLFGAAVYVFYTRQETGIQIQELQNQPKISLFQYEFYRTKDDIETSRLIGKTADLMEGGVLQLRGGARGYRTRDGRREEISGQEADIKLQGTSPGQLQGELKVVSGRFRDNVEILLSDMKLESQLIDYSEMESKLSSDQPVRISQKGQFLAGEGGFEYGISKQTVKLRGGVTGTLVPKELREKSKKGKDL